MRYRLLPFAAIASLVAVAASFHDAYACGGGLLYSSQEETASDTVDGHRIALSMSTTQTVLWDQITYSGNPKDFAWVMPVPPGSSLDLASDAWLDAFDDATVTRVFGPRLDCPEAEHGGCSGSDAGGLGIPNDRGLGNGAQGGGGVTVLDQHAVGPYETVTIKSETPGAIGQWLTDHGYKIPAAAQPILDDYASKGMDFIALRLKSEGSQAAHMRSVRVTMPGSITTFPMRMLSIGAQKKVALKVFVLSEGRLQVSGFPAVELDPAGLRWDFDTGTSNYSTLRDNALHDAGDNAWITTYARRGALLSERPADDLTNREGARTTSIGDTYFERGVAVSEIQAVCPLDSSLEKSSAKVVNVCAKGALCTMPAEGELDARSFNCDKLTDLGVALTGLHPKDVWVSRFEANLSPEALNADLTLSPLATEDQVENYFATAKADNIPDECTLAGAAVPGEPSSPRNSAPPRGRVAIVLTALAAAAIAARRARRLGPALVPVRAR